MAVAHINQLIATVITYTGPAQGKASQILRGIGEGPLKLHPWWESYWQLIVAESGKESHSL